MLMPQACLIVIFAFIGLVDAVAEPLPNTIPLETDADLAMQMVDGIRTDLERRTAGVPELRAKNRRTPEDQSAQLARIIGAGRSPLAPTEFRVVADVNGKSTVAETSMLVVQSVQWSVYSDYTAEGLMIVPKGSIMAHGIVLGDCDWTPEQVAGLESSSAGKIDYARRIAESGCLVVIPQLVSRESTYSGHPDVRFTNQPHREFLYRAAYEMGTHIIGLEVDSLLALRTALQARDATKPIGMFGYGEGGLLALYTAALDPEIDATVVSGYFQPRDALWSEPIYRNVWSLLTEFGDAEIAALIAPRTLIIEPARMPETDGPTRVEGLANTAAPGKIATPPLDVVVAEYNRARALADSAWPCIFVDSAAGQPGHTDTLTAFANALHTKLAAETSEPFANRTMIVDAQTRAKRQFDGLMTHIQNLVAESPKRRAEFWKRADKTSVEAWQATTKEYREYFHREVIGALPDPELPLNPRTRLFCDTPKYTGYEVVLDVYPDVIAYGILLLPKDLKPGEQRPVVVCQHGLEGRPQEIASPEIESHYYHQYGCRLAEEGFIVYAPQNPYIGEDRFRLLQRMANPLKLSIFSYIVRQHQQTIAWLKTLPNVDPDRIAFYGLRYGGKTAMRVPAILEDYCLSICSGDFNEWIWKNTSNTSSYSYLFTGEYEMFEFDLGSTYNYGELTTLIFPRPFMVERGHNDGVAPDEQVSYEFAKTRRFYTQLGMGDKTEIEYFDGPHEIHLVGTMAFLKKHLQFRQEASN